MTAGSQSLLRFRSNGNKILITDKLENISDDLLERGTGFWSNFLLEPLNELGPITVVTADLDFGVVEIYKFESRAGW